MLKMKVLMNMPYFYGCVNHLNLSFLVFDESIPSQILEKVVKNFY